MATDSPDLLSKIQEILAVCPKFRILLVGNSGVGKSSLISSVLNISPKVSTYHLIPPHDCPFLNKFNFRIQDTGDYQAGKANIATEFISIANSLLILHDSQGFQPGSNTNRDSVVEFIKNRCADTDKLKNRRVDTDELKNRLYAIWLCIETPRIVTPRFRSRLHPTGDEEILELARKLNVAIVVVFTKFDLLVNQYFQVTNDEKEATKKAEDDLQEHITTLTSKFPNIRHATIFADQPADQPEDSDSDESVSEDIRLDRDRLKTLTKETLVAIHDVFKGDLWILWATAQQINVTQKVNGSIEQGLKKYWLDLGKNAFLNNHLLGNCLARIHNDIILVWNFYDPNKILPAGGSFEKAMQDLITKLLERSNVEGDVFLDRAANIATIGSALALGGAPVIAGLAAAYVGVEWCRQRYKDTTYTKLCIGAYIVDLILILEDLFRTMLLQDPPRPVSEEQVMDAFDKYKQNDAREVHSLVREIASQQGIMHPERMIAKLIWDRLDTTLR